MKLALRRSGLILCLFAALAVMMATVAASAPASPFCGGQKVSSTSSCWGAERSMSGANAYGQTAGVCVGADLYHGTCAPTGQLAVVNVPTNPHNPWVYGTGAVTVTYGNTW
jgi:hypothetical protein